MDDRASMMPSDELVTAIVQVNLGLGERSPTTQLAVRAVALALQEARRHAAALGRHEGEQ